MGNLGFYGTLIGMMGAAVELANNMRFDKITWLGITCLAIGGVLVLSDMLLGLIDELTYDEDEDEEEDIVPQKHAHK